MRTSWIGILNEMLEGVDLGMFEGFGNRMECVKQSILVSQSVKSP